MIVVDFWSRQADPNERRWSLQSSGKRVSAIRRETVRSGSCRPDRIDARAGNDLQRFLAARDHSVCMRPTCSNATSSLALTKLIERHICLRGRRTRNSKHLGVGGRARQRAKVQELFAAMKAETV